MALPIVALVGPPNVGKSTLFNLLVGKRAAVTGPTAGTTRDRAYAEGSWQGRKFMVVDTGGLARKSDDPLEEDIRQQTEVAVSEADLILFVTDGKQPYQYSQNAAREFKTILRTRKLQQTVPVIAVINKVDSPKLDEESKLTFARLGLSGQIIPVSAITGRNVGDLLDLVNAQLAAFENEQPKQDIYATVGIIGRPNAGKSTLLNAIAGGNRVIVSDLPGTTRSAIDVFVERNGKTFKFIDTAGIRRRARIDIDVEEYALFQAYKSLEASDVVVLLLDASEPVARLAKTIAGSIKESTKGIVIALNKIDLLEDEAAILETENAARALFPFLKFARIVSLSASQQTNLDELFAAIVEANESRRTMVPSEELDKAFKSWQKTSPPRRITGRKKPIVYAFEEVHANPPTFELVVNEPTAIHFSYLRFLENQIRKSFGFIGTAIRVRTRKPHKRPSK